GVLHRHVPPGEGDHAGLVIDVPGVQRGAQVRHGHLRPVNGAGRPRRGTAPAAVMVVSAPAKSSGVDRPACRRYHAAHIPTRRHVMSAVALLLAVGTIVGGPTRHPGIHFEVVDSVDPVKVGGETVYEVKVRNTGTAADKNVGLE